jgi:hypothetical protein
MELTMKNVLTRIPHEVNVGSVRDWCVDDCLCCAVIKLLESKNIEAKQPREAFARWMDKVNPGWNGEGQPHEKLTERLIETLRTGFEAGFRYSNI